jgi:transposase
MEGPARVWMRCARRRLLPCRRDSRARSCANWIGWNSSCSRLQQVEAERDAALAVAPDTASATNAVVPDTEGIGGCLLQLKGIGPEAASILTNEAFFRDFQNRREIASYAGLTPSPWQSGGVDNEQGISKSGNGRVRKIMVQIAWIWLRHQPASVLSVWYHEKVRDGRGRIKRIAIIALARKLLVALWRLVTQGVVPNGPCLSSRRRPDSFRHNTIRRPADSVDLQIRGCGD